MGSTITRSGLRRTTGGLLVMGAVGFAVAATVLSVTFDWPDSLREPGRVVLPGFAAGSASPVWTWLATAWTYAILAVPILLLPAVLGRRDGPALRVATYMGAGSVALSLIGFLFGGALVGEHLGQLLVIGWSVTLSVIVLRTGIQPRWLGGTVPRAPLPNPSASRPASAPPAAAGLRS